MKNSFRILAAAAIGLASVCFASAADTMGDGVMMKNGQMMVMKNGDTMAMSDTMQMKNGDKVMTDGTVMTPDGQKMMLREGDSMSMDGTMMKAGDAAPMAGAMADGFMMKDGKMMVTKDGKTAEMVENMKMDDGTVVYKDGTVVKHDGSKMTLGNGDAMAMDGTMTKSGM